MSITSNSMSSISETTQKNLSFGQRISLLIEEKGISKHWLAEKLGISKQALNYLINHSSKPKYIDELAQILQANPYWIEKGEGTPFLSNNLSNLKAEKRIKLCTSETPPHLLETEILASDDAFIDFEKDNAENYIAYKISNDSLFPPFIEGSILIFDKTKFAQNGDYVLFSDEKGHHLMVRKFFKDGADIYYQTNNDKYKSLINEKAIIIGILIEARYQMHR